MFSLMRFAVLLRALVRPAAVGLTLMFVSSLADAQDWARTSLEKSPRHREYVAVKTGSRTVNTLVVYPESAKKAPVVVMIHEIFGLTDWAKLMADELAAEGYIVVEPDLLSGVGPGGGGTDSLGGQDAVVKAVSGLPQEQVAADLSAVADWGVKLPSANGKLAVAGFCWGGGKAFAFATQQKGISAAFVFYGPPPPTDQMGAITAPVYGFYGGLDERIDATIPGTVTAMKAAVERYEPVTYAGAGHGFMRAGQASDATPGNAKAWHDGFARMLGVLAPLK